MSTAYNDFVIDENGVLVKYNGEDINVVIPNRVTYIGDRAFEGCKNMRNIVIPDGVTHIGNWAFHLCEGLESITIPDSVICIGEGAFYWCQKVTHLTIGAGVMTIGNKAFRSCTSITTIVIPNSVTSLGREAFAFCKNLISITLPHKIKSIGDEMFQNCDSLKKITIPNGVTSIGTAAFRWCKNLIDITIPRSVIKIGGGVFLGCDKLTIHGVSGSYAELYAQEMNIPFGDSLIFNCDYFGVYSFCFGEDAVQKAVEWMSDAWDHSMDEYIDIYTSFNSRLFFDSERVNWIDCSNCHSKKRCITDFFLKKLSALTAIGVTDAGLCVLVSDLLWMSPEQLYAYIETHGKEVIANILNTFVKSHDAALLSLTEIFDAPDPYEMAWEISGAGYDFGNA